MSDPCRQRDRRSRGRSAPTGRRCMYCPYCAEETLFPLEDRRLGMPQLPARVRREVPRAADRPGVTESRLGHDGHRPAARTPAAGRRPQPARRAGQRASWPTPARTRSCTWAYETFGAGLVLTSSLADTVLVHLAEQVAPGIDVLFLDTGYHFVETIGTRDAVAAVHDVNLITPHPGADRAEQDATWGKDLFAAQPRPVLRAAQGRAAERGARAATGVGQRRPPGRLARPGEDADRVLGPAPQDDQDRPDRGLDRRRRRRLHRSATA